MHLAAVLLVALAGACCMWSAWRWWRLAGQVGSEAARPIWLYVGVVALTLGLALSLADGTHPAFTHGVIGVWACLGSLVFLRHYLTAPSRKLLLLPAGGMAILLAMAGLAPPADASTASGPILILHIVFMTLALTAHLVSAGSGLLYLLAVRSLKEGAVRALRMPALPNLDRLCERALVIATGLLLGGLATGGVAMRASETFRLSHPASILALIDMAVLVVALALRTTGHLGRRSMALTALVTALLLGLATASFIALRHG